MTEPNPDPAAEPVCLFVPGSTKRNRNNRRGAPSQRAARPGGGGSDDEDADNSNNSNAGPAPTSKPASSKTTGTGLTFSSTGGAKRSLIDELAYTGAATSEQQAGDAGATRVSILDGEEAEMLLEKERMKRLREEQANAPIDDKQYRGLANYTEYVQKREGTGKIQLGPVRASGHIRAISRMDYQPDVCKDYKDTGYCGYGDNCIYMHDRGDYKSGWQLEREWDEEQKRLKDMGENSVNWDEEVPVAVDPRIARKNAAESDMPFACFICRQDFTDPVVTRCGHYFCEFCFTKHTKKSKTCYVCDQPTMGLANVATALLDVIKRRKEAAATATPKEAQA